MTLEVAAWIYVGFLIAAAAWSWITDEIRHKRSTNKTTAPVPVEGTPEPSETDHLERESA